jgi:hypothetical protein
MKKFYIALCLIFISYKAYAFDASPFNTQSAELSKGGWWTIFSETYFVKNSKLINPLFLEYRYTFFDKFRLGALGSLSYADDGSNQAFGLSNFILTTEYEVYDLEKHEFLKLYDTQLIDHAALFFNQFIPIEHDEKLGFANYAFNTGIEWQKQLNKYMGLYSELGYFYFPLSSNDVSHRFLYNNSLSFEVNDWFQPYIEVLGLSDFNTGDTELLLAPGISLDYHDEIYLYLNPIFSLTGSEDWGFQVGLTGNI